MAVGNCARRTHGECQVSQVLSGHSVGQLDLAPQLLVWALRRRRLDGQPSGLLAHGFRLTFGLGGVERALSSFEALFGTLEREARTPLQICCLHCALLSADEWAVLELVRCAGNREIERLRSLAQLLVLCPADLRLAEEAVLFARHLATAEALTSRPEAPLHETAEPPRRSLPEGTDRP